MKDHKVRLDRKTFNELLHARIVKAMKEKKVNSIDLSKVIGCAASTIRMIKSTKGGVHFYTAISMFEALDIDMAEFLSELEEHHAWERKAPKTEELEENDLAEELV